jgi:uncharacterized protein YegL
MANFNLITQSDLIDNPSPRCACMLVLDTSASMSGQSINQLNQGFQHFINAVQKDEVAACSVDLGVITAGGSVCEQLPFTNVISLEAVQSFGAGGGTPLGEAVNLALQKLETRKKEYQKNGVAYYQPWLIIISDGEPTDAWQHAASQSQKLSASRKLVSVPIGVAGANLNILSQFSSRPAKALDGLKFEQFFEWLSASMSRVSASASTSSGVQLPPTDSWESI